MSTIQRSTVLDEIRRRGHWRVVIRPTAFDERRVARHRDLLPLVERGSVRLRGRDFPHIDRAAAPIGGRDWVGQEGDWQQYREVWRLYQSGLFVDFSSLDEDWRDRSTLRPAPTGWAWGEEVLLVSAIYSILEFYEFASRLALTPAGAPEMQVEIGLLHLGRRRLVAREPHAILPGEHRADLAEWRWVRRHSQADLIAAPRPLAAEAAQDFCDRFGLDLSIAALRAIQDGIGRAG